MQLAANAQDHSIKQLIVQLLQELQPEVDECHESAAGQDLLKEMTARRKERADAAVETLKEEMKGRRTRKAPERYASLKFDKQGAILPRSSSARIIEPDSEHESDEEDHDKDDHDEYHERPDDVDSDDEMLDNWGDDLVDIDIGMDDEAASYVNENYPDDETRHKLALLQLPAHKTWSAKDLDNELFMRVGLHLLYNKIHGGSWLHLGRSIHVAYLQFSQKVLNTMKGYTEVSKKQMKAAMSL